MAISRFEKIECEDGVTRDFYIHTSYGKYLSVTCMNCNRDTNMSASNIASLKVMLKNHICIKENKGE